MESYCANCGTVHEPGLSPLLCRQRRDGALASYGRILTRDEVVPGQGEKNAEALRRRGLDIGAFGTGAVMDDGKGNLTHVPLADVLVEKTGGGTSPAERFLAAEGRARARGRSGACVPKPKPSLPGAGLAERLARTEQRLAELRAKERVKKAKWRKKERGGT